MNELMTTSPQEDFRAIAADRLHAAAEMTLHNLVDEFQRLTAVMKANVAPSTEDEYGPSFNHAGQVAQRERNLIEGVAKARFGISFSSYDEGF